MGQVKSGKGFAERPTPLLFSVFENKAKARGRSRDEEKETRSVSRVLSPIGASGSGDTSLRASAFAHTA
jgi:hypothetical protein